jgi:endonuclease YncB( thermonuclease family)
MAAKRGGGMAGRRGKGRAVTLGAVLLVPLVLLVPREAPEAAGPELSGRAEVTDGDTLRIGAERIRLFAIDAPERGQRCGRGVAAWDCGRAATARLEALVAAAPVHCIGRERDRYGRLVATCSAGGIDLGGVLVAEGLARAYTRYGDDYAPAEATARTSRLGLWRSPSEAPWDHRAAARQPGSDPRLDPLAGAPAAPSPRPSATDPRLDPLAGVAAGTTPPGDCRIKGNVSSRGARLYHMPGSPSYERTRIDTARGEAWFCDEAAARAAGFRSPGGG